MPSWDMPGPDWLQIVVVMVATLILIPVWAVLLGSILVAGGQLAPKEETESGKES